MLVGNNAPEFSLKAYTNGKIRKVKLADFRGQWKVLFFYTGDFTFV